MTITPERKQTVIAEFGATKGDTGSPEVQVAVLSERITNLTEPFQDPRQGQPFAPRADQARVRSAGGFSTTSRPSTRKRYEALISRLGLRR